MPDLGEPLNKAPVNANGLLSDPTGLFVGVGEVQRRIQTALNEWAKGYFSGSQSTLLSSLPDGTTEISFPKCVQLWGRDPWPEEGGPVIHWASTNLPQPACRRRKDYLGYEGEITWNVLVRVTAQNTVQPSTNGSGPDLSAKHLCRQIADQLVWLLRSTEKRRLSAIGVSHVNILRGPDEIPGGQHHIRQVVVQHRYFHEVYSPLV